MNFDINASNVLSTACIFPKCAYAICSMVVKPYVSAYMPAAPRIPHSRQSSLTCRSRNANGLHMMVSSRMHEDTLLFIVILFWFVSNPAQGATLSRSF